MRMQGDDIPPEWPEKWFDTKFRQASTKFADTFHKFHLVAGLIEQERINVFENKDELNIEKIVKYSHGLRILPVHLDSLLFYMRILADNIADLTPYLYPESFGRQFAVRSFRRHRKWFLDNEEVDPTYTGILQQCTDWFDVLAGKERDEGIRDKMVHYRGTFQLSYNAADSIEDFQITAGMIGDSGWLFDDIFPLIISTTAKFFIFMDKYLEHFVGQLDEKLAGPIFDMGNPINTELFRFNKLLPSFWLFPEVSR